VKKITKTFSTGKIAIEITTLDSEASSEGRCVSLSVTRNGKGHTIELTQDGADEVIAAMLTGRKKRGK